MKAKNENGIIKEYPKMPNSYKGVMNVLSDYANRTELHEADGFFDVFVPNLMPNEQKGAIYFDENINAFTYSIEIIPPPTQAEIEAKIEADKENAVNQKLDSSEQYGLAYFIKIRNFVQRNYDDGVITKAQFLAIRQILHPALLPLKDGNWDIAQSSVLAIMTPTNAKMLFLYNKVKTDIDNYILEH